MTVSLSSPALQSRFLELRHKLFSFFIDLDGLKGPDGLLVDRSSLVYLLRGVRSGSIVPGGDDPPHEIGDLGKAGLCLVRTPYLDIVHLHHPFDGLIHEVQIG